MLWLGKQAISFMAREGSLFIWNHNPFFDVYKSQSIVSSSLKLGGGGGLFLKFGQIGGSIAQK